MTGQSETKHTPGQISFSDVDHAPVLHLYADDNKHLFHGVRSLEEQRANAARIALTWNCHDELVTALRQARAEIVAADVLGARNEAGFVTDMALWAGRAVATIDAALANAKASA